MAKVLYINDVDPSALVRVFKTFAGDSFMPANLAIKVHSGEMGNVNFLTPEYLSALLDQLDGTIVETNTAYDGERNTTDKHMRLLQIHGWTRYPCDILDGDDSDPDHAIDIDNGNILQRNIVGKRLLNYKHCVVISHFKAHPMGGFGGALKQLSIGFASRNGKVNIHGYGNMEVGRSNLKVAKSKNQEAFLMAMADAASTVHSYFSGGAIYINILKNIATSCDCDASAPPAKMHDLGILVSTDPIAIDVASINMLYDSANDDPDALDVIDVINRLNGINIIRYAQKLGFGSPIYNLQAI